jgi:uncharacterized protein YoaH (UPF0181 family)
MKFNKDGSVNSNSQAAMRKPLVKKYLAEGMNYGDAIDKACIEVRKQIKELMEAKAS